MSAYKEVKELFFERLAHAPTYDTWQFGVYPEIVDKQVPKRLLEKWTRQFYKGSFPVLSSKPRLVNHFSLGADPEFVFMHGTEMIHATELELKAGLCVGADNNGRLAELRPKPSKSALHVVASLYAELCFLAQHRPALTKYTWFAHPYVGKDGLGGHIHFGRWHPLRNQETSALDGIMHLLTQAGAISQTALKARLATPYGRFGDIRPQAHGYEYRTFPTWVGCPRHAHLYLTLAKLAVHNPNFTVGKRVIRVTAREAQNILTNLLCYYKDRDDDARLALRYVSQCWTSPVGDMQKAWGIVPIFAPAPTDRQTILPPVVAPKEVHIDAMFRYLAHGVRVTVTEPFETLSFPEGYRPLQQLISTERKPELGELVWDMALLPETITYNTISTHGPARDLRVNQQTYNLMQRHLKDRCLTLPDGKVCMVTVVGDVPGLYITFPNWLLERKYKKWLKKFLTEDGIFPLVRLGQSPVSRNWKIRAKEKLLLHA